MELKVWVDGIQRVVCGANYSTTCQDVVLALAHAMGRTGRFTLVEKWRDTERPLTPGECPLQALQKWGEYAGEVKFFLVQAETEKVARGKSGQQSAGHPGKTAPTEKKMDKFTHNFSPTPSVTQQRHPAGHLSNTSNPPSSSEAIRRSSTFSGAHNPIYAHHPPSSSQMVGQNQTLKPQQQPYQNRRHSPHRPSSSSQHQYANTNSLQPVSEHTAPSKSRSSSQTRQRDQQRLQPHSSATLPHSFHSRHHQNMPNGDISALSPASSNNSSPRSPSSQLGMRNTAPHNVAEGAPMSLPSDLRHLHPAQLPSTLDGRPSNHSSDYGRQRGRPTVSQHNQQQQPHPTSSQNQSSSSSSSTAYPTPAPRARRQRASPASPTSQQYENLPPVRPSRNSLPPGQSLSTLQAPVRPHRSSSSGRRSSNDEHSYQQNNNNYNTHSPREIGFAGGRPDSSQRDAPDGHSDFPVPRMNTRKDMASSHGPNSLEAFANEAPTFKKPPDMLTKAGRDFQNENSMGYPPPLGNVSSRAFPGDSLHPQISQGVPIRSAGQRRSDSSSQQMASSLPSALPSSNTLERNRRSQGDKVSFVESAFLRQQRLSREGQTSSSSSSSATTPRQQTVAQEDRYPNRRQSSSNHFQEPNDFADPQSLSQNGFQTSPRNLSTTSSHQPVLPTAISPSPYANDPTPRASVPQPSNALSSPRRHSAFKEVSPRSSRPNSASSPAAADSPVSGATLVAYNLDEQNLDHFPGPISRYSGGMMQQEQLLPAPLSHSRQASLEIEEYDLDQNFPDVFPNHRAAGMGGVSSNNNVASSNNLTHMEYVMDSRQTEDSNSEMEAEYMHLLRKVNMQQERMKVMEAQTNEISTEIEALEVEESTLNAKLDVVQSELEDLEQTEETFHIELADLERVEWVDVVDGELKCEQDIKRQMMSLNDGLRHLESQLEEVSKDEVMKLEEIKQEEEIISQEKLKAENEEEELKEKIAVAERSLSESNEAMASRKEDLNSLLKQIADLEKRLLNQETEASVLESELQFENLKDFQSHPVPKEAGPPMASSADLGIGDGTQPASPLALDSADTGEAILKILEEGRSPRVSPAIDEDSGGSISPQHVYSMALATKNPNGVWV